MSVQKNIITNLLNYLPSLIILIFSMLALHYSLLLIDGHQHLSFLQIQYEQLGSDIPAGLLAQTLQEFSDKEFKLYWSVIAMGLSGFVLVLLNTDKFRKLRRVDEERKDTLKLLESRLAAMEATLDGIGIFDAQGQLTYMNSALIRLHGVDPDLGPDLTGQNWNTLYEAQGLDELEEEVLPALDDSGYWYGEAQVVRKDGGVVKAELSLTRLIDGGLIVTVRDMTEKAKADTERQELESQFFQAQKMEAIGRLAGGIAHDFNNILAAMNGYAEFLVDDLDEESQQYKFASNILQAGQQARSLVDQMLAFSRRSDSEGEHLDLNIPVQESLAMLEATLPKTIEVKQKIDVSSAPIQGNATQLAQLIMNLCVNAQDAMEDDRGSLSIGLKIVDPAVYAELDMVKEDPPTLEETPLARIEDAGTGRTRLILSHMGKGQEYVCLSVSDTGSGMSRTIMGHIFEPFFTTKPVNKGTGLGLATVHGVVVSHQGAMIIDSTLGKGTSFELFFPVDKAEDSSKAIPVARDAISAGGHVLLVEDQSEVRDMMMTMLERIGYEAHAATTGLEALDFLRENPETIDVVITDQNMPKMTGLELVTQAHMDFPDLPFILLSGYSEQKLQDLMEEHPAIKAMLRKPVTRSDLAESVAAVIATHSPVKKQVA